MTTVADELPCADAAVARHRQLKWFVLLGLLLLVLLTYLWNWFNPTVANDAPTTVDAPGTAITDGGSIQPDYPLLYIEPLSLPLTPGEIELSGLAAPDSILELTLDGQPIGTALVDATGIWTYPLTLPAGGQFTLSADNLATDGTVIAQSSAVELTVLDEPGAPSPIDAPQINLPEGMQRVGSISLDGTGLPAAQIKLFLDDSPIGTTDVDDDGTWHYNYLALRAGEYQLSAHMLDADGNFLAQSVQYPLSITTVGATGLAPILQLPESQNLPLGSYELRGQGLPGTMVELLINGDTSDLTAVNDGGFWQYSLNLSEPGPYAVVASTLDKDGRIVAAAPEITFTVGDLSLGDVDPEVVGTLPEIGKTALATVVESAVVESAVEPVTDNVGADEETSPELPSNEVTEEPVAKPDTVEVGPTATATAIATELLTATVNITQSDAITLATELTDTGSVSTFAEIDLPTTAGELSRPAIILPDETFAPGLFGLSGTGAPESKIELIVDGESMGVIPVDSDGRWDYFISLPETGSYTLHANALDEDNALLIQGEAVSIVIAKPVTQESRLVINAPVDEQAAGPIELSGSGEPLSTIKLLLDDNVVAVGPVDQNGQWVATLDLVEPRSYTIVAQGLDAAGQVVVTSDPVEINIGQSNQQRADEIPTVALTSTARVAGIVELGGTALSNANLQVLVDGEPIGTTTGSVDGNWVYTASIASGDHQIVVNALDKVGAVRATSPVLQIRLAEPESAEDNEPSLPEPEETPNAPSINAPDDGCTYGVDLGQTWRVGPCDTLWYIGQQTTITLDELLAANPSITNASIIYLNQQITLPGR